MFNVQLESFDAGSKPKIIREVKAMVPNLTLIDVRYPVRVLVLILICVIFAGEEIRRISAKDPQGEPAQGGGREVEKDLRGPWRRRQAGLTCIVHIQ